MPISTDSSDVNLAQDRDCAVKTVADSNFEDSVMVGDNFDLNVIAKGNAAVIVMDETIKKKPQRNCLYCHKSYNVYSNLYRHMREKHKAEEAYIRTPKGLICPDCGASLRGYEQLRGHVTNVHGVSVERQKIRFTTEKEFQEWKETIEVETKCCYVLSTKSTYAPKTGDTHVYFKCFRSGVFKEKAKGNRRRKLKHTGSVKMNGHCPSVMEIRKSAARVKVVFYPTHFGHNFDIRFLPPKIRLKAAKLAWYSPMADPAFAYCRICNRKFKSYQKAIERHQRTGIHQKSMQTNAWVLAELEPLEDAAPPEPQRKRSRKFKKGSIHETIQNVIDNSRNDAYSSADDKSVASSYRDAYLDLVLSSDENSVGSPKEQLVNNRSDNLVQSPKSTRDNNSDDSSVKRSSDKSGTDSDDSSGRHSSDKCDSDSDGSSERNSSDKRDANTDDSSRNSGIVNATKDSVNGGCSVSQKIFSNMLKQLQEIIKDEVFSDEIYGEAMSHLKKCINSFQGINQSRDSAEPCNGGEQQQIQIVECVSQAEGRVVEYICKEEEQIIEYAPQREIQTVKYVPQTVQAVTYAPQEVQTLTYQPQQGIQAVTYDPQSGMQTVAYTPQTGIQTVAYAAEQQGVQAVAYGQQSQPLHVPLVKKVYILVPNYQAPTQSAYVPG